MPSSAGALRRRLILEPDDQLRIEDDLFRVLFIKPYKVVNSFSVVPPLGILYLASGLFILYLGYSAYLAWHRFDGNTLLATQPSRCNLLKAATINAISPGPYLFWGLVTGPILLSGWHKAPAIGLGFLFGFYATMITCIAVIILIFGKARQLGPKVTRVMLGVSAFTLLGFGLYQLWLGLSGAS